MNEHEKVDNLSNIFRIAKSESGRCRIQYNVESNFLCILPQDVVPSVFLFHDDMLSTIDSGDKDWSFLCNANIDSWSWKSSFPGFGSYSADINKKHKFFDNEEDCINYIIKLNEFVKERENEIERKRQDENVVSVLSLDDTRNLENSYSGSSRCLYCGCAW